MVLLQNKLNLRVSQKQILTPGLVQMVSVLALNKLELKEMINTEMVENPVLEELDSTVPLLDEIAGRQEAHERQDAKDIKEKDETGLKPRRKIPLMRLISGRSSAIILIPAIATLPTLKKLTVHLSKISFPSPEPSLTIWCGS